jgi:type VI secretion system protein ImpJ
MTKNDKPVWIEGMALDPQHFQQWDRYHTALVYQTSALMQRFGWGFTELEVDREALTNGSFELRRCSGRTPDGLVFSLPDTSPLPDALPLKDKFPATLGSLTVLLGIPAERPDSKNCRLRGEAVQTRFFATSITVADENTGSDRLEIEVVRPNFLIVCASDRTEGLSVLPVAEVVRSASGMYSLGEAFVPPCMAIGASERLTTSVRGVLDRLVATSDALHVRRRASQGARTADPQYSGALVALNAALPVLRHHAAPSAHPEAAYLAMASLAGQLAVFAGDSDIRPAGFPPYDHEKPQQCFDHLRGVIFRILDGFLAESFMRIALEKAADTQWTARIPDPASLGSCELYLSVSGELAEKRFTDDFVYKAKIACPEELQTLIMAALPGLPLAFTTQPPANLPGGQGIFYYRLTRSGKLWDAIERNGKLSVFVPAEYRSVRMDLFAVK